MDELIVRQLQGRATPPEEWWLRQWRERAPENEHKYQEIAALWRLTSPAAPDEDDETPDVASIIERAEASSTGHPIPDEPGASEATPLPFPGSPRPWWYRASGAAVAAAFTAIGVGIGSGLGSPADTAAAPPLLEASEIVTGAGELTTMTLGDGSSIRLGPNSRLRLAAEEDRRIAWLEGRAFFGVQADSTKPFVVRTGQGEARALGTRFEVRAEDEFRVLVVDGSVAVSAAGTELRLSEGEMSRSVGGMRPSAQQVDDVFDHLDWIGNAVVFQATPLARAVREIERRYGVSVRLEDPDLAELTVTATFTARPLDEVTFVLCEIVNTPCSISGDSIRIGSAGSPQRDSTNRP